MPFHNLTTKETGTEGYLFVHKVVMRCIAKRAKARKPKVPVPRFAASKVGPQKSKNLPAFVQSVCLTALPATNYFRPLKEFQLRPEILLSDRLKAFTVIV